MLQNKNRKSDDPSRKIIDFKTQKKLRERRTPRGGWNWFGVTSLAAWFIALPTVVGAILGHWLDSQWPTPFSWSLALMLVGAAIGCITAWRWVRQ